MARARLQLDRARDPGHCGSISHATEHPRARIHRAHHTRSWHTHPRAHTTPVTLHTSPALATPITRGERRGDGGRAEHHAHGPNIDRTCCRGGSVPSAADAAPDGGGGGDGGGGDNTASQPCPMEKCPAFEQCSGRWGHSIGRGSDGGSVAAAIAFSAVACCPGCRRWTAAPEPEARPANTATGTHQAPAQRRAHMGTAGDNEPGPYRHRGHSRSPAEHTQQRRGRCCNRRRYNSLRRPANHRQGHRRIPHHRLPRLRRANRTQVRYAATEANNARETPQRDARQGTRSRGDSQTDRTRGALSMSLLSSALWVQGDSPRRGQMPEQPQSDASRPVWDRRKDPER